MIAAAGYAHDEVARTEAVRRLIVRLVFVVFVLLVFEGALRKWVLPDFQRPLYFARDPFIALIYLCVLLNGLILRSRMLTALGLFAVGVSAAHLLLALVGIGHPVAWALGVRHCFFYIPLAFVIGWCFRFDDLTALIRLNLVFAVPIAVLVYLQHISPPSAFVNRALAEGLDNATWLAGDILRPYGTFTYTGGHVLYVAASVAMLAAAWLLRREMRLPLWLLLPASAGIMVMTLTTGSRSIWFFLAHVILCLGAAALSAGQARHSLRALGFILLVALGTIALYASVLAPAYEAMENRFERATRAEGSFLARPVGIFAHAFQILDEAPVTGFGLGSSNPAARAVTGDRSNPAEGDWDRMVLELGPVFGLVFIAMRVVLVAWLLWRALVASRLFGNPVGLMLFGFVGPHLLVGQIAMSGMGSIFAWLFVGLLLAATNPWTRPPHQFAPAPPAGLGDQVQPRPAAPRLPARPGGSRA